MRKLLMTRPMQHLPVMVMTWMSIALTHRCGLVALAGPQQNLKTTYPVGISIYPGYPACIAEYTLRLLAIDRAEAWVVILCLWNFL
jgi:hypothetical protein